MKIVYTLAALAFLASTANAATKCWPSQGNWVNASTKSCAVPDGGSPTKKKHKCDHEAPKV